MDLTIGISKNGLDVDIADTSPNQHVSIFGMSGSGKSTRIREIILSSFKMGNTTIVFDIEGMDYYPTDALKDIDPPYLNRISALHDGIDLHFLDNTPLNGRAGLVNSISYIADVIFGTFRLGPQQSAALKKAISYAIQNVPAHGSEMDAIATGLMIQDTSIARSVSDKLWHILKGDILRNDGKDIEKGKINILSFQDINPSTQKDLTEIVLASIWRTLRSDSTDIGNTSIVLDEFQKLSLKQDSTLLEMLRESRKYGVSLILSTQTVTHFKKETMASIAQTAVQLYFRPSVSDVSKIAAIIDPDNTEKWANTLRRLKIGESVILGDISIRGKEIKGPLIIHSHYKKHMKNNLRLLPGHIL